MAKLRQVLSAGAALAIAITAGGTTVANAQSEGDLAQVMAAMKRLEARVAALEGENKEVKKQAAAARAEAQALRQKLGVPGPASVPHVAEVPSGPYAMATKVAVLPPPESSWSGLYVGGSFGAGVANSKITSSETYVASFPPNISGLSNVATGNGSGGVGAVFDAFLGVNTLVGSRFVAGLQVEGTLSDVDFNSSGMRNYTYFNAAGPTGQTATSEFRPHVHARWMASALMRVGLLADPDTLLYGSGGWTGAQFEYNDLTDNPFFEPKDSFWANGGSLGAGIERKFGPNWSLRAEYRYTLFANRDIANNFLWTSFGAGPAIASTQTNSIQTAFHNSMQVARLGVSYQLPHW